MTTPQDNDSHGKGKIIQTALEPAAKEFAEGSKGAGKDLGEAVALGAKSVKALLSPLKLVIWGYEQFENLFIPEVERKLEGVPKDRRMEPSLLISGPTVEALRFAGGTPELREMFANLLATAIDAETARNAHPSFVDMIKQLSPDEARILKYMRPGKYEPVVNLERRSKGEISTRTMVRYFSLLGIDAGLEHGDLSAQYIDNLCRLGLCEVPPGNEIAVPKAYEQLEAHPDVARLVAQTNASEEYEANIEKLLLRLTSLGRQFVAACVKCRDEPRTLSKN